MFLGVFSSVSSACFKCFICLQTYVATIVFDISKADRVLHLYSSPSAASSRCVLLPTLVDHPYDAVDGSLRIRGAAPFPLIARAVRAPHAAQNERDASRRGVGLAEGAPEMAARWRDGVVEDIGRGYECAYAC